MKEIREIRMVEQTNVKFIADDGKEFVGENAERECKVYERTLTSDAAKMEIAKLNIKKLEMPFGDWCSEGYDLYFAHFENVEEYYIFKGAMHKLHDYYDDCTDEPKEFPCDVIYSDSYDGYLGTMSNEYATKQIDLMKKMLEKLEELK